MSKKRTIIIRMTGDELKPFSVEMRGNNGKTRAFIMVDKEDAARRIGDVWKETYDVDDDSVLVEGKL